MGIWNLTSESEYIKYELLDDSQIIPDSPRIVNQDEGVDFVLAKLKSLPEGNLILKTIYFTNEDFSHAEAKLWLTSHKSTIDAFSPEVFESPAAIKAENMLVELKELDAETLKTTEKDELEAVHALLHAMHFRDKAGMATEGWESGRIRTYHGQIVEALKFQQADHFSMSDLDEGTWTSKDITGEVEGDVLTQPNIGEHRFRSVMTASVQGHAHCATIGPDGNGFTSVQKEHSHLIERGKVQQEANHTHPLTQTQCTQEQMKWLEGADANMVKNFVLKSLGIS